MCLQQKVYSSLQMWAKIKGSNTEIQAPFPFGTCFYFLQWLYTRISICCPYAAYRLTSTAGFAMLLSQPRSTEMNHSRVQALNISPSSRSRAASDSHHLMEVVAQGDLRLPFQQKMRNFLNIIWLRSHIKFSSPNLCHNRMVIHLNGSVSVCNTRHFGLWRLGSVTWHFVSASPSEEAGEQPRN